MFESSQGLENLPKLGELNFVYCHIGGRSREDQKVKKGLVVFIYNFGPKLSESQITEVSTVFKTNFWVCIT